MDFVALLAQLLRISINCSLIVQTPLWFMPKLVQWTALLGIVALKPVNLGSISGQRKSLWTKICVKYFTFTSTFNPFDLCCHKVSD